MAAVPVCVCVCVTERLGEGKGLGLHPSFTPTTPYRYIHTNLHAVAAVAKCEQGPTPTAGAALASQATRSEICPATRHVDGSQECNSYTPLASLLAGWHPSRGTEPQVSFSSLRVQVILVRFMRWVTAERCCRSARPAGHSPSQRQRRRKC